MIGKSKTCPFDILRGDSERRRRIEKSKIVMGSESKVFAGIACASHFVVWEKQHAALHQASREWLTKGTFNGVTRGMFRIDPQGRLTAN
jgi:hypothetical protein